MIMAMKKILMVIAVMLGAAVAAVGQQLEVGSLELDGGDLSAQYVKRLDGNGAICALLKVATMAQNPQFHGNLVGKVEKREGYYWVYMTVENPASRDIRISSDNYLPMKVTFSDYGVRALAGGCTYVLTLVEKGPIPAKREEPKVTLNEAVAMYNKGDYANAVKHYERLAKEEDATAQCWLGYCYEFAKGVTRDYSQAVYWYRKAAEQGDAIAQYNLGVCYENGRGVTQDYVEAVAWYRKAAEQGYASAQNNLGYCYKNGQGVTQDYSQAVYWYRKSAEQGYAYAQNNLGYCYEKGQGVEKDLEEAIRLYKLSANQGNDTAKENLRRLGVKGY